jgi:hypothetical protein
MCRATSYPKADSERSRAAILGSYFYNASVAEPVNPHLGAISRPTPIGGVTHIFLPFTFISRWLLAQDFDDAIPSFMARCNRAFAVL